MKRKFVAAILSAFVASSLMAVELKGILGVTGGGRLPRGMFARAKGYIPGDYIKVNAGEESVELLVVGSLSRDNYYSLLVTKEVARMLDVKTGNEILIEKRNSDFTSPYRGKAVLKEVGSSKLKEEKKALKDLDAGDLAKKNAKPKQTLSPQKKDEKADDGFASKSSVPKRPVKKFPAKVKSERGEDLTLVRADSITPKDKAKKLRGKNKNNPKKKGYEAGGNVIYIDINNNIYTDQKPSKQNSVRRKDKMSPEMIYAENDEEEAENDLADDEETTPKVKNDENFPGEDDLSLNEETDENDDALDNPHYEENTEDDTDIQDEEVLEEEDEEFPLDIEDEKEENFEDEEIVEDPPYDEDELYKENKRISEDKFFGRNEKEKPIDKIKSEKKDEEVIILDEEYKNPKAKDAEKKREREARDNFKQKKRPSVDIYGNEDFVDERENAEKKANNSFETESGRLSKKDLQRKNLKDSEDETGEAAEKLPLEKSPSELFAGTYYVQICRLKDKAKVKSIVDEYSLFYPMAVVRSKSGSWQVLVGPLGSDEYGVVRERFRAYGFKDSFVKRIAEGKKTN